jgi:hypothetical protein
MRKDPDPLASAQRITPVAFANVPPRSPNVNAVSGHYDVIEYLIEENRTLREQVGNRRLRFNDNQRRRLAAKAKKLGRKLLAQVATIVTPETLLASTENLSPRSTMEPRLGHWDDAQLVRKSLHWLCAWRRRIDGVTDEYRAKAFHSSN